ncbi:MAG: hypothetical protein RIB61_04895 [Roseicyclus sp.]|jgi:hypothetical protein
MRRDTLIAVSGLSLAALAFGLWAGLRAVPPGETEIILNQAQRYADQTGRPMTECHARPSPLQGVRLVVICGDDAGAPWAVAVDDWGNPVDVDLVQGQPST